MLGVALGTALLLLVPAVAMQFTPEVSWGPGDFVVAAVLLFGAGALAVLGFAHVKGTGRRAALLVGIACSLALVWAELAVGLFT
jgi:hypothetical protein